MSEDPTGAEDGPNVYAYGDLNPVRYIDPNGTSVWRVAYRASKLVANAAGDLIGSRLGGALTEAQAIARRALGKDVTIIGRNRDGAIDAGRRLEEAANAGRGEQLFHGRDAHATSGNQPHWQTDGARGHTFVKWAGGTVLALLAGNALAASEAGRCDPTISVSDVVKAGVWDIARALDPFFITDVIEYFTLDH